jgi:hypothetical protein
LLKELASLAVEAVTWNSLIHHDIPEDERGVIVLWAKIFHVSFTDHSDIPTQ